MRCLAWQDRRRASDINLLSVVVILQATDFHHSSYQSIAIGTTNARNTISILSYPLTSEVHPVRPVVPTGCVGCNGEVLGVVYRKSKGVMVDSRSLLGIRLGKTVLTILFLCNNRGDSFQRESQQVYLFSRRRRGQASPFHWRHFYSFQQSE